jgi:hypothetical protein
LNKVNKNVMVADLKAEAHLCWMKFKILKWFTVK